MSQHISANPEVHLLLIDAAGRKTGFDESGKEFTQIPGVEIVYSANGMLEKNGQYSLIVPDGIAVDTFMYSRDGGPVTADLAIFAPGTGFTADAIAVDSGRPAKLRVDVAGDEFRLSGTLAQNAKLELATDAPGPDFMFTFPAAFAAGGSALFSLDREAGTATMAGSRLDAQKIPVAVLRSDDAGNVTKPVTASADQPFNFHDLFAAAVTSSDSDSQAVPAVPRAEVGADSPILRPDAGLESEPLLPADSAELPVSTDSDSLPVQPDSGSTAVEIQTPDSSIPAAADLPTLVAAGGAGFIGLGLLLWLLLRRKKKPAESPNAENQTPQN